MRALAFLCVPVLLALAACGEPAPSPGRAWRNKLAHEITVTTEPNCVVCMSLDCPPPPPC